MLVLGGYGDGIGFYRDGELRVVPAENPSFLAVAPNGVLYAAQRPEGKRVLYTSLEREDAPGSVLALRSDGTVLGEQPSGGEAPCHLTVHPDGRWLYVANYGSGTVAVLPVRDDGSLGEPTDVVQHVGSGPVEDRQEGPHAHQVVVDPSGRWLLAVDLGADEVVTYDAGGPELTRRAALACAPGSGPRHLAFAGDGRTAYVVGELDDSLTTCAFDPGTGALTAVARTRTLPDGAAGAVGSSVNAVSSVDVVPSVDAASAEPAPLVNYPAAVVVASDGRYVYVTNRGHDSIAVIDTASSELVTTVPCGGSWPRDAALGVDGSVLYVANQFSDTVTVFDLVDGLPVPNGTPIPFTKATSVLPLA